MGWIGNRLVNGVLSYYADILILVPFIKGLLPGAAGTIVSCFVQMLYVTFLFPWLEKHLGKNTDRD